MPRYSAVLSGKSFRALAKQIADYRKDLEKKCKIFAEEVAQLGYDEIQWRLEEHNDTGLTLGSMEFLTEQEGDNYVVKVRVTSDAILFLEFGSGLKGLNEGPGHPYAADHGMMPGTYPGEGHWDDPEGWFYYNSQKGGKRFHTYGQVASMPMYFGGKKMREEFRKVAKEVFRW